MNNDDLFFEWFEAEGDMIMQRDFNDERYDIARIAFKRGIDSAIRVLKAESDKIEDEEE